MFCEDFIDEHFNVDLDIISSLVYVHAVVQIKVSLAFDGDGEPLIDEVHDQVRRSSVRCSDGKIVYLSHKEDALVIESAGVKTWLVGESPDGVSEALPW